MTDRYIAFTVTLDKEIRDDDCEPIINAIQMIKHVRSVQPVIADANTYWAREAAAMDIRAKIFELLVNKK